MCIAGSAALFSSAFGPFYLFFDTYHYMVLSYHPTVGDAHPLGFGFLLRTIEILTRHLPLGAFELAFAQVLAMAVLLRASGAAGVLRAWRAGPWWRRASLAGLVAAFAAFGAPALLFLMSGYTTEMTAILLVCAAALFVERGVHTHSRAAWAGYVLSVVLAWHLRYQLALLAIAAPLATGVVFLRRVCGARTLATFDVLALAATLRSLCAPELRLEASRSSAVTTSAR